MKKRNKKYILLLTGMLLLSHTTTFGRVVSPTALSQQVIKDRQHRQTITQVLDKTTQDLIANVKEPKVGSIGGEWVIFGLARRGEVVPENYYDTYYENVVTYVKAEASKTSRKWKTKVTETQRIALAVAALGKDPTDVGGVNLLDYTWNKEKHMSDLGPHGSILGNRQGLNELVFGLIALDLQNTPQPIEATVSRESIIKGIIENYQTQDGGFSLNKNEKQADVDMTAMTLQALAPYYQVEGYEDVTEAVNQALSNLSKKQREDGGFENAQAGAEGKSAPTSESTAQVIVALCSLGINPHTDPRFVKHNRSAVDDLLSYGVASGGFKHLREGNRDQMATEQAYYALVAYERLINGKSPIYQMLDDEKDKMIEEEK